MNQSTALMCGVTISRKLTVRSWFRYGWLQRLFHVTITADVFIELPADVDPSDVRITVSGERLRIETGDRISANMRVSK